MTSSAPAQTPIAHPRRLLILTPTAHSLPTIPPLLHSLTGVPVSDIPTANPDPETETETGTGTDTPQTQAQAQTFAGYTTHSPFHIENRYYAADVPVWVDEIPAGGNGNPPETVTGAATATTTTALAQWRTEFSSAEARIVRDAIGGVMVCIRNPDALRDTADPTDREDVKALKDFLRCIGDVKRLIQTEREGQDDDEDEDEDGGGGLGVGLGDVLGVIVLVEDGNRDAKPRKLVDGDDDLDADLGAGVDPEEPFSVSWWEDQLDDIGLMDFEVVSWDPRVGEDDSKDKYGEYRGMRRIRQILETHDWSANDPDDPEGDISRILGNNMGLDDDLEEHLLGLDSSHGFNLEVNELEREMLGLRMAIEHGDEEGQDDSGDQGPGDDEPKVESMEALMMRMQAIKDMSADLPENERRRFAAKAVRDIMKEI